MRLLQTEKFTIKQSPGPSEVQCDAWEAICKTVGFVFRELTLPGHLFVTVVGCDTFGSNPEDPDDCGWGLYHQGIQHVAIAAGDGPDELKNDREQWVNEVRISTAHELVHYWQEINGKLDGSEDCEREADKESRRLIEILKLS